MSPRTVTPAEAQEMLDGATLGPWAAYQPAEFPGDYRFATYAVGAATLDVLRAMLAAQPGTVAELVAESDGNAATPCGKVVWSADGRAVWAFGKHKGQPIGAEPAYARWVLGGTFSPEVKALAARGARGEDVRR
mgnify:FL=1